MPKTTPSGITYPVPADLHPSATWWKTLADSTEAAISASSQKSVQYEGAIPATVSSVDSFRETGLWDVLSGSAATALGLPGDSGGILEVRPWGRYFVQRFETSSAVYTRWSRGDTAWYPWSKSLVGGAVSYRGGLPAGTDLDNFPELGYWEVMSGGAATDFKLPVAAGGLLEILPWGRYTFQIYRTVDQTFTRWQGSSSWHPWKRTDAGAVAPVSGSSPISARTRGMKTIPVSLTLGQGSGDGALVATLRVPVRLNARVTRWRLCIANRNPRYSTDGLARKDAVSFSDLYVGDHSGGGKAPSLKNVGILEDIPSGSHRTSSKWISNENIGDDREVLLSFGYSAAGAPRANMGGGWTTGSVSDATSAAPASLKAVKSLPFHMWLEVETPSFTPVLAAYGDSLTCGVGATTPVYDSWLSQYTRKIGALPIHYSASGDYMGAWLDPNMLKWQQWQHCDRPDSVIFAMGSNDVFSGASLQELKDRHAAVSGIMAELVSPVQYAATVMPRTYTAEGELESTRRQFNQWLLTQPNLIRDTFRFDMSISTDDDNILPEYDSDGIHLTTTGYAKNAAAINRPVTPPRVLTA